MNRGAVISIIKEIAALRRSPMYRYVKRRLRDVEPFMIVRNPESHLLMAIEGVTGAPFPDRGFKTKRGAVRAWRETEALLLTADWENMLDRLIKAQELGHVPDDE